MTFLRVGKLGREKKKSVWWVLSDWPAFWRTSSKPPKRFSASWCWERYAKNYFLVVFVKKIYEKISWTWSFQIWTLFVKKWVWRALVLSEWPAFWRTRWRNLLNRLSVGFSSRLISVGALTTQGSYYVPGFPNPPGTSVRTRDNPDDRIFWNKYFQLDPADAPLPPQHTGLNLFIATTHHAPFRLLEFSRAFHRLPNISSDGQRSVASCL